MYNFSDTFIEVYLFKKSEALRLLGLS